MTQDLFYAEQTTFHMQDLITGGSIVDEWHKVSRKLCLFVHYLGKVPYPRNSNYF